MCDTALVSAGQTSRQSVLVLQQGCLELRNKFCSYSTEKKKKTTEELKYEEEHLQWKYMFSSYFQAPKYNISTPNIVKLCIDQWEKSKGALP